MTLFVCGLNHRTAPVEVREQLAAFHRRFDAVGVVVRRAVIGVQVVVAVAAATIAWEWTGFAATLALALGGVVLGRLARRDETEGMRSHFEPPVPARS